MKTAPHTALRLAIGLGTALAAAALVGCDRTDSTTATPANTGTGMTGEGTGKQVTGPVGVGANADSQGAGGAPTYGEPTGTGFPSGDAAHSSGQGSGLMGFHGTGAMGTSAAVSDAHDAGKPAKDAPALVLPEQ